MRIYLILFCFLFFVFIHFSECFVVFMIQFEFVFRYMLCVTGLCAYFCGLVCMLHVYLLFFWSLLFFLVCQFYIFGLLYSFSNGLFKFTTLFVAVSVIFFLQKSFFVQGQVLPSRYFSLVHSLSICGTGYSSFLYVALSVLWRLTKADGALTITNGVADETSVFCMQRCLCWRICLPSASMAKKYLIHGKRILDCYVPSGPCSRR